MAGLLVNLLYFGTSLPYSDIFGLFMIRTLFNLCYDPLIWIYWWLRLCLLTCLYYFGRVLSPIYSNLVFHVDVDFKSTRLVRRRNMSFGSTGVLPLDCRLCVYTSVINIQSSYLVYLRKRHRFFNNSFLQNVINFWNKNRESLGQFPPYDWLLKLSFILFATIITICLLIRGYFRILYQLWKKSPKTVSEADQLIKDEAERVDCRHLDICSVDPPGKFQLLFQPIRARFRLALTTHLQAVPISTMLFMQFLWRTETTMSEFTLRMFPISSGEMTNQNPVQHY